MCTDKFNARRKDCASQANVNMPVGLAATIAACCCSGLAGVYFELILKKTDVGLWVRNIQLGLYSIVIGTQAMCLKFADLVMPHLSMDFSTDILVSLSSISWYR